ncbi:hypothetical protein G15_3203 [Enterococcus avium]|uniref:hypothetical protein n=1 Tax=Enterococcus malodoratus TaxID=71451 RepID=UPI0008AFAAA3|nr:hypothetical protein [Enterococcus malodoratus]BBM19523.1 hypothetical protein G15_3203 [Enterococcus avium]SET68761.1 hypothetical protein SAMN04487821_11848 [Enterococcus malodoratus]
MKWKKINFLLLTGGCFLLIFCTAEVAAHAQAETPVAINIIETPIRLVKVRAPTFETAHVSSKRQTLKATGNLEIQVKDLRQSKTTPWKLLYQLTDFSNGKKYSATINLGKGTVRALGDESKITAMPHAVSVGANEIGTLVTAHSAEASDYLYRVDKQAIALTIPGNLPAGKFTGKQTVLLLNTPEVN